MSRVRLRTNEAASSSSSSASSKSTNQVSKQQNSGFIISSSQKELFSEKNKKPLSKPTNSYISEFLKLRLQTKTEIGQFKDHEIVKEDTCFILQKRKSVYSFIPLLIEVQDTKLLKSEKDIDPKTAFKKKFESCSVQLVQLFCFNGKASKWLEFIKCFYRQVDSKYLFGDIMRMTYLISAIDGEAKKTIEVVGTSGLYYANTLKTIKYEFGNILLVAQLHLNFIPGKAQKKPQ